MAPRALESKDAFVARLRQAVGAGERVVRFGGHHFTHAVCVEPDAVRVRRLEYTLEEAEAHRLRHGRFMSEDAEAIGQPRTVVLEAGSVEALVRKLRWRRWPLR